MRNWNKYQHHQLTNHHRLDGPTMQSVEKKVKIHTIPANEKCPLWFQPIGLRGRWDCQHWSWKQQELVSNLLQSHWCIRAFRRVKSDRTKNPFMVRLSIHFLLSEPHWIKGGKITSALMKIRKNAGRIQKPDIFPERIIISYVRNNPSILGRKKIWWKSGKIREKIRKPDKFLEWTRLCIINNLSAHR